MNNRKGIFMTRIKCWALLSFRESKTTLEIKMEKLVKMYQIVGHTQANKYCCSGWSQELKRVVKDFISNYPRFKGEATIQIGKLKDCGRGMYLACGNPWVKIDTFQSTKELKNYIK